jgi:formylglycine-generating enzyme required for sulfatase activity/5-hydroxyisourate hydrolase-like protein (transthyretin family)
MKIMSYSFKLFFWASLLLTTNSLKAIENFSIIPAGPFKMGNSVAEDTDIIDAPIRTVILDAFYMGKHEVTKAEWDQVRNWAIKNGYNDLREGGGKGIEHPVHSISWYDIVKWCNARSEKDGLTPVYYTKNPINKQSVYKIEIRNDFVVDWSANGYRLPTEAEWEKAARGGKLGNRFPWGDSISHDLANYYAQSFFGYELSRLKYPSDSHHPLYIGELAPYTSPVGEFNANDYGLYDIIGNVGEWCWDWYGEYPSNHQINPRGYVTGTQRISRGGSWNDNASSSRLAFRSGINPAGDQKKQIGFRLVRNLIGINGKVTDQYDSPLSGVQVTAHQYNPNGDSSYWMAYATTDDSGFYTLAGLDPGTYRVRFNTNYDESLKEDFAPQYYKNSPSLALAQDVVLTSTTSVNNIDAVLISASKITGRITSASDGKPIENILVLAHRMMGNGEWDWSSWVNFTSSKSDGSYVLSLPEGTYLVSFHDYNDKYYVTEFYDNQRKSDNALAVDLGSNSTVGNINASLAEGSYIEGVVRADANSAPLQGISVSVHEYNEEDDWWNWVAGAETDQNGAYSIGGLGAGTYRVEFRDPNGVYAFEAYNDAAKIKLGGDVVVSESSKVTGINASLGKASSISGKVTGIGGIRLSTVELDLERLGDDGEWHWHADTETDEDGDYEFSGLRPGIYRVEFEDESGEYAVEFYENVVEFDLAKNINLGQEQHLTINASLVLGSQITGKITGPIGSPLADVWVDAFRLNSKGKWEWYEDTEANADGTYQMGGLPNGTYRVGFIDDDNFYSVQFHGNSGSTIYLESAKDLVIKSPKTISGINGQFKERAATIAGNVKDANGKPLSGVRIEAYRKDSPGVWRLVLFGDMEADDRGFFDPDMLPAGTYRFKFEKEGYFTNYYGNSATFNNAKDIVVGDGGSIDGIDVVMRKIGFKYPQTIGAFAAIPAKTFGNAPFAVTAPTASSGLSVVLSVKSGPATIKGNMVTITGVGTVVLAANQTGNANYSPAAEVTTSFTVSKATQTIGAFAAITPKTFGAAPFAIASPAASSKLPVSISVKSGPATIKGNKVTITGVGTVVIGANQAGNANYEAAPEVTTSFVISKAAQTIRAFSKISNKTFGSAPFKITAPVASSKLPVTLSVKSGPATILGNTVTLTGTGPVVLAANQFGNDNYNTAPEVTVSFTVAKATQTIRAFAKISSKTVSAAPFAVTAPSSNRGLPVTMSVKSGPATISGNTVTLTGAVGTVVLAANQVGDANYSAAKEVTTSFKVTK